MEEKETTEMVHKQPNNEDFLLFSGGRFSMKNYQLKSTIFQTPLSSALLQPNKKLFTCGGREWTLRREWTYLSTRIDYSD